MTYHQTIKYAMMPHDLFQRRWYVKLRRQIPNLMERWYWIVCLAHNSMSAGRILIGGEPATAEDVAISWDREATEDSVSDWQQVLDALTEAGVLTADELGWSVTRPSDWYRPPSREPEAEARRKRASRAKSAECPDASADVRSASGVSGLTKPNQTKPNQTKPNGAGPAPGVGSGMGLVMEVLERHWPGGLAATKSGDIAAYLRRPGTLEQHLEAIRQVAEEVAAEIESGSDIRSPSSVVLHRAPARLAHLRNAPPDPWANPPELPEYAR